MTTNQPRRMRLTQDVGFHRTGHEHDEYDNCEEFGCTPITGEAEGAIEAAVERVMREIANCRRGGLEHMTHPNPNIEKCPTMRGYLYAIAAAAQAAGPAQQRVTELETVVGDCEKMARYAFADGINNGAVRWRAGLEVIAASLAAALSETAEVGGTE